MATENTDYHSLTRILRGHIDWDQEGRSNIDAIDEKLVLRTSSFPSSPVDEQMVYRQDEQQLYQYDESNSEWDAVTIIQGEASDRPTAGTANRIFLDHENQRIERDNGSDWEVIAAGNYADLNDTSSFPIPNNDLANSSVTVAGSQVALGASTDIAHGDLTTIGAQDHHGAKNSVEFDSGDVQLVGDEASPSNDNYYGTDSNGNLGFFPLDASGNTDVEENYLPQEGLVIANNDTNPNTQIDLEKGGQLWVHDPDDETTGMMVKIFRGDGDFDITQTGIGGLINGSSLSPDTWYELGVIGSTDPTGSPRIVGWTDANRPTQSIDLPSGYDLFRPMGTPGKTWWIRTDGSSNIYSFTHQSDGSYIWTNSTLTDFNDLSGNASPDGTEDTVDISSQAPPVKMNIKTSIDCGNSSGSLVRFGISSQSGFDIVRESMVYIRIDSNTSGADAGELKNVTNQEFYANNSGGSISGFLGIRYVNWFKAVD